MTIYVLTEYMIEENPQVIGVYLSKEDAFRVVKKYAEPFTYDMLDRVWKAGNYDNVIYPKYQVEEFEVDQ